MKKFPVSCGLTLIELLIVVGLFGVIMVAVISFLVFSTRTVQKNVENADVSQNARLGMDRILGEIRYGSRVHTIISDTHLEIEDTTHQDSSDFEQDPPVFHPKYIHYEFKDLGGGKKVIERYEQVCYEGAGPIDNENKWRRKDGLWDCAYNLRELGRYDAIELVDSVNFQCPVSNRCSVDLVLKKGSTPVKTKGEAILRNEKPF